MRKDVRHNPGQRGRLNKSGQSLATKAAVASGVLTGILVILAVPYLFAAMLSVMLFDAPGSTSNPWAWAAFLAICLYPVLLVTLAIASWVSVARGRYAQAFKVAVGGSILASLPAIVFLLAIAFE